MHTSTSGRVEGLWLLADESIDKMRASVDEIRRKIPRLGDLQ